MPKDKAIPPADPAPDNDRGTLRPTVIGPASGRSRTPVVSAGEERATGAPVRATVIEKPASGSARSGATAKAEQHVPPRPAGVAATAIPGVERKRIAVDLAEIRKVSPQVRTSTLEAALRLVETFVVDRIDDRQAVLWGHRLQQDYSNLVSQTLELSQADVLKKVAGYIGRMTDILSSIDLEAVSGAAPAGGLIGQYLKGVNRKIDTPAELHTARRELDQLVKLMGDALQQLLSLKETLARHSRQIEAKGDEVEAAALAAQFLSEHLSKVQPALSQRFIERAMSLTQTIAQIRGNASLREAQIEQPLRLIAAIQNVALVTVPGWLVSIAGVITMLESKRKLTPTEAGELAYQLRNILQQLKP